MNRALLLDEMISPRVAEQLRSRDVDVKSIALQPELRGLPDSEVLELATQDRRIVVTPNIKDFEVLHRSWATSGRQHAGIVFVVHSRVPRDGGTVGRLVMQLKRLIDGSRPDAPEPGGTCFL